MSVSILPLYHKTSTSKKIKKIHAPFRIEFQEEAARVIREKEWHPTQRLEQKGKKTILHMEVQGLPEVARWVLYHSPNAKVLAPPSLKEMVADFAAKTANRHEKRIAR